MPEDVLDTNIIARLLTDQPPEQSTEVALMLERARQAGVQFVVPALIVAEAVYVLTKTYERDRARVARALIAFFASGDARPDDPAVIPALAAFAEGADFPDAYIMALAHRRECRVVSFDQRMGRAAHVVRPPDWQAPRGVRGRSSTIALSVGHSD